MAFDKTNTKAPRKRKKVCQFCVEKKNFIDYKDTATLRHYVSERAKILPRRTTGVLSAQRFCRAAQQASARCTSVSLQKLLREPARLL